MVDHQVPVPYITAVFDYITSNEIKPDKLFGDCGDKEYKDKLMRRFKTLGYDKDEKGMP